MSTQPFSTTSRVIPAAPALPSVRWVKWLAVLLVLKTTASVLLNYRNYFPANFGADFLLGREGYFFGSYQWAFYLHIIAGPVALVLGLILISDRYRVRFPQLHRRLGRVQAICVLLFVAPSGLWMAFRAQGGPIAIVGFATLAMVTGGTMAFGWRAAVLHKYASHRVWMWRCYLLLCSAVVIRLIGGLATVLDSDALWIYPASAWASWLVPLVSYEFVRRWPRFEGINNRKPLQFTNAGLE